MKIQSLSILMVLVIFQACEKDQITRGEIIGSWILDTRHIDTLYSNGKSIDTTIIEGNNEYIIGGSDTLTICILDYYSCNKYLMKYQSPNTLIYYSCPIDMACLVSIPMRYEISKVSKREMIWKREIKYINQTKLMETMYFVNQH
jgi:hypothetical protein